MSQFPYTYPYSPSYAHPYYAQSTYPIPTASAIPYQPHYTPPMRYRFGTGPETQPIYDARYDAPPQHQRQDYAGHQPARPSAHLMSGAEGTTRLSPPRRNGGWSLLKQFQTSLNLGTARQGSSPPQRSGDEVSSPQTLQSTPLAPPVPPRPISLPSARPAGWQDNRNGLRPPSSHSHIAAIPVASEIATARHPDRLDPKPLPPEQASLAEPPLPQAKADLPLHDESPKPATKPRRRRRRPSEVIDLTYSPPSTPRSNTPIIDSTVTPRSTDRRRRAISEQPLSGSQTPAKSGRTSRKSSPSPVGAVRCAGFTRAGQPCKRLVKAQAPYLALKDTDLNVEEDDGTRAKDLRYCKDHASMICDVEGFYVRGKGTWIKFDDYVKKELGQQTQTLLRTTMESSLTDKESPGFLYVYELRDLQTANTCFFKVGRTDNVPRRIGEWTNQCQSHTPTLREIFPRRPKKPSQSSSSSVGADLHRQSSSFLPGAFYSGSAADTRPRCPAMKRWEKLVHLELAELSSACRPAEFQAARQKCSDCGKLHREVFPLPLDIDVSLPGVKPGGGRVAYELVVEIIGRWERFVREVVDA